MAATWYRYGKTPADFTITEYDNGGGVTLAQFSPGAVLLAYNAETGGTPVQYALDRAGTTLVASITSSDGSDGLPPGTVPEHYTQTPTYWIDGGAGFRLKMVTTDVGDGFVQNASDITDLQNLTTNNAATLALAPIVIVEAGGVWPARPTVDNVAFWIGPDQPTAGGTGMRDGDEWHRTAS